MLSISSNTTQSDILSRIENNPNILTIIGMKMIKQQQSMDQQLIDMIVANQPKQVPPKSENSTVEFIA